jgi:hypothetical protein
MASLLLEAPGTHNKQLIIMRSIKKKNAPFIIGTMDNGIKKK